jgi:hypothetical protein
MSEPQRLLVFYSWQSDLSDKTNRGLIRRQLRAAASKVEETHGQEVIVKVDEATRDVSGSPNIPATILAKIASSDLFICDVTTINSSENGRKVPNPNVVFELGYAVANIGWERIVLLFNTEFGSFPADLPFDFDRHRASPYFAGEQATGKQKENLSNLLEAAIRSVLTNNPERPNSSVTDEEKKRSRDIVNIRLALNTLHLPTIDQHILDSPHMLVDKVLHFWEGFNGVIKNSLFHLYDKPLLALFKQLHEAFYETVRYEECYHSNINQSAHIFTNLGDLPLSEDKDKIWNLIQEAGNSMYITLEKILSVVRENYLEISIDVTNMEAWREYVQFQKTMTEDLEK